MRRLRLTALVWLFASAAWAQTPRPDALYVNPAALVTASRLVGLAGASTGLSENTESIPTNYAAAAGRHPRRDRNWDWDYTLAFLTAPVASMRDVENDGSGEQTIAPVEGQVGITVQIQRFGVGVYSRASTRGLCLTEACEPGMEQLEAQSVSGALVAGYSFLEDQLLIGAGLNMAFASFQYEKTTRGYLGLSLGLGVNWRPHTLPLRLGVSYVSQSNADPQFDLDANPTLAGRPLYQRAVSPPKLSFGACTRVGEEAWRFNRQSPSAIREHPSQENLARVPHDVIEDWSPPGAVLVCAQLDVVFPVENATTLTPFLLGGAAPAAGAYTTFIPRLGVEWEAITRLLRLRAGTYLHPAQIEGSTPRPHFTTGLELRVVRLLGADWSLSASANLAPRLFTMSFGIGWWL
ncbi:MAG: hypothetical protein AB1938_23800 [Myxococcota bacterium]